MTSNLPAVTRILNAKCCWRDSFSPASNMYYLVMMRPLGCGRTLVVQRPLGLMATFACPRLSSTSSRNSVTRKAVTSMPYLVRLTKLG